MSTNRIVVKLSYLLQGLTVLFIIYRLVLSRTVTTRPDVSLWTGSPISWLLSTPSIKYLTIQVILYNFRFFPEKTPVPPHTHVHEGELLSRTHPHRRPNNKSVAPPLTRYVKCFKDVCHE